MVKRKRRASDKERLELAKSRAGAGQEHKLAEGKIESTTKEERRNRKDLFE